MITNEGRFTRVINGIGNAAIVSIEVDVDSKNSYIIFKCCGENRGYQGEIEEATKDGYLDWKQGAAAGAEFAISKCVNKDIGVTITKIRGLTTDTTPTTVGVATMIAVWNALDFTIPEEISSKFNEIVYNGWKLDFDKPIDFFKLF